MRWAEFAASEPEFAARVRALLDAHKHKTLATLRRDGSPRISGTEAEIADGDLWLGMMAGSRKSGDVRRDPRIALHGGSDDPPVWTGDAKLSGLAVEEHDAERKRAVLAAISPEGNSEAHDPAATPLFRIDLREVVVTRLGDPADHLVIEAWSEIGGLTRVRR